MADKSTAARRCETATAPHKPPSSDEDLVFGFDSELPELPPLPADAGTASVDSNKGNRADRSDHAGRRPAKLPRLDVATVMGFIAIGTAPAFALFPGGPAPKGRALLIDVRQMLMFGTSFSFPKILGYLPPAVIRTMLGKGWLASDGRFFQATPLAREAAARDFINTLEPLPASTPLSGGMYPVLLAPDTNYLWDDLHWPAELSIFERIPEQPWIGVADGP
jgi:hypothetical protein